MENGDTTSCDAGGATIDSFRVLSSCFTGSVPDPARFPTLRTPYFRNVGKRARIAAPSEGHLLAALARMIPNHPAVSRSTDHPDLGSSEWRAGALERKLQCVDIPAFVRQFNCVASGGFGKKRGRDADVIVFTKLSAAAATLDNIFRSAVYAHTETVLTVLGSTYRLPQGSAFAVAAAVHFAPAIAAWVGTDTRRCFRSVVLDPPWHNRSATRGGGYATGGRVLNTIGSLPLMDWIRPGAIVGVWVTHDSRTVELARSWLARWLGPGVSVVQFAWLKVCETGEPCFPLPSATASVDARKPFEVLLLARYGGAPAAAAILPPTLVFSSIPSHHSRKPPLAAVFAPYVGAQVDSGTENGVTHLELFGRELQPGSLCIGDDALRFNDERFFLQGK